MTPSTCSPSSEVIDEPESTGTSASPGLQEHAPRRKQRLSDVYVPERSISTGSTASLDLGGVTSKKTQVTSHKQAMCLEEPKAMVNW